ncbi:hypothetical protein NX059_003456 [Plenodomus lindquistii]|nr:hypothetical protein NX059_003456 [Plenodomus lindquistii]
MPEKIWRKKIHGKQPRELPSLKNTPREANSEDASDRRRTAGWRKTIQGSRPVTPSSISPLTPTVDDADDVSSEHSEPQTPRRNSKPKLTLYTSLFSNFKESAKGPEFAEPWAEDAPPSFHPYIDPLHALQSVHSHMINFFTPIPLEHNSGLFRVFEDYRKVRLEKERLEALIQNTLTSWTRAEAQWAGLEFCYKAEIRRLEILIANGRSGMTGLFKARQGSVVDRKRDHQKTASYDRRLPISSLLSNEKLDFETSRTTQMRKSYQVATNASEADFIASIYSSISSSANTTHLSEELTTSRADQLFTEHLNNISQSGPSRKACNEFDSPSIGRDSGYPPHHDHNSDEKREPSLGGETTHSTPIDSDFELDSFIALRELGVMFAKRRGIEPDTFTVGLVALLSKVDRVQSYPHSIRDDDQHRKSPALETACRPTPRYNGLPLAQKHNLRRLQSQPQLSIDQQRQRHFSFDLGDDQLQELAELGISTQSPGADLSLELQRSPSSRRGCITPGTQYEISNSSSQASLTDSQKPTKIPSPVGTLGRTRREGSTSSSQTLFARPAVGRRESNTSVRTAFKKQSRTNLRPVSTSTCSSFHDACSSSYTEEPKYPSEDCQGSEKIVASTAAEQKESRARSDASNSSTAALLFGRLESESVELQSKTLSN